MGVCLEWVVVDAMRYHQSGSTKRQYPTIGIASHALSYLSQCVHYEFGLCCTYGVHPDSPLVWWSLQNSIDYDIYIKCVKGDIGNALTLF